MTDLVAVDIGGTHARFAIAEVADDGSVRLGPETVLKTGDYAGLAEAWRAFAARTGSTLPPRAGVAVAGPVDREVVRLTNNRWELRPVILAADLGIEDASLVNDFAAVAHAVHVCGPDQLAHICGVDRALPDPGVISVVGPGTGLGVAILDRKAAGAQVIATEGGHVGFAPGDAFEDRLLERLRERHGRASAERVVSGAGLREICALLGAENCPDDASLWASALDGTDARAAQALHRYFRCLGRVAGDLALAHGAGAVVIAGGLGLRLAKLLPRSDFSAGFADKGRFREHMAAMPVKLITHPQPGLLGAAAAFAAHMKKAPLQG